MVGPSQETSFAGVAFNVGAPREVRNVAPWLGLPPSHPRGEIHMGMIGRWIDEKCREEPDVMRRVLNRKFGPLGHWVVDGKCGCLVGSWALERGDPRALGIKPWGVLACPAYWVGIKVYTLTYRVSEAVVIRLVKQRIRKALGVAAQEHRPVESLLLAAGSCACHTEGE